MATLFATRCRHLGPAIVLIARREAFIGLEDSANVFSEDESEVALKLTPTAFRKQGIITVNVERAREVLRLMGFELPVSIATTRAMGEAIKSSREGGQRLTPDQIQRFVFETQQGCGSHGL